MESPSFLHNMHNTSACVWKCWLIHMEMIYSSWKSIDSLLSATRWRRLTRVPSSASKEPFLWRNQFANKNKSKKPCDILIIWWLFWSTSSQKRIRCRGGMAFKFYSRLILLQNKNVTYDVFFFAYLLNHNFQNTNIFLKLFDGEIRLQIKTVWD